MGFLDKLTTKIGPISDEKALEIIRGNLGLIESLTKEYIRNNGVTQSVALNERKEDREKNQSELNTAERNLLKAHEAYPDFYFNKPHYYVACSIFNMYTSEKIDKETKKEYSNYLANGIFSKFVDKYCRTLLNDVGTLTRIPRTRDQVLLQVKAVRDFSTIMLEYPYVVDGKSISSRSKEIFDESKKLESRVETIKNNLLDSIERNGIS